MQGTRHSIVHYIPIVVVAMDAAKTGDMSCAHAVQAC